MQRSLLAAQFDAALELKDAGTSITATGVGQVGGVNRVVNVGPAFLNATWIVDVDLLDLTTGDEVVEISLQGSTTADFSSDVVKLAGVTVGDTTTAQSESADAVAGRYERTFINTKDGVKAYPYLRVTHKLSGTTPSITYRSFITKNVLAG